MLVFIEQRHIDAAGSRAWDCPIALALVEQLGLDMKISHNEEEVLPVIVIHHVRVNYNGSVYARTVRGLEVYDLSEEAKRFMAKWDESPRDRHQVRPCVVGIYQTPSHYIEY